MSLSVIQRSVNRETTNASRLLDARTPKPGFDQERKSGTRLTDVNSDLSDEELVLLARSGNRDAFAKLTCRHFSSCLKRALLILHNRCDAEDEVQNAFTRAFQCLEQFRSEGPFSAWLFRIVQNQCLMLMREQRQADLVYVDVTSDSKLRLELVDQMPDQEEHMGAQEVMSLLRREISHVPPLMRNVLRLRDIEGLPMPEVAARLGLSIPAAKSRLMRARKELRERLTKYCGRSGPRTLIERPVPEKAQYTYIS
ncbi:MAG: sigma-70 family RNA polymerase sigma factor [Acidobacteriaceae bacterium]|nr:sigma-70 family RNA polymerase sigma factor [Acidobacteriaceae bacterium]